MPTTQSRLDTADNVIESTSTGYDALHRAETSTDSRTAAAVVTRTAYHSVNGLVLSITDDLATGTDRVTSFTYNNMGQRIAITLPDSSVTHTSYWPTGNEKASWGSQTNPTVKLYDAEDRLTHLRTFRSTNLALAPDETTTGYDETEWIYNDRGLLRRKEFADGKGTDYTYTPAGRLQTRTWARTVGGNPLVTTYGYTAAGELETTDYSDTTPDVSVVPDKLGRQHSVTNGIATSVFTYDPATLAPDYETIFYDLDGDGSADFTRVLDRSRDTLGRDKGWQLKDGSTVENEVIYNYHPTEGRLSGLQSTAGTFSYLYTPGSSLLASTTSPVHTVTNTWEPDRDILDLKENKVGTTAVSSYDYTVNALGQRTDVAQAGTAFAAARGIVWGYDALGQVTGADSTENTHDRAYQYDSIGNRIEARDGVTTVTGTPNYTATALNQYSAIGSLNPVHDDDGNATAYPLPADPGSLSTLVWDAENRLIEAQVGTSGPLVRYDYDSQSRRIARTVGADTTLYLYDGWNVIAEYSTLDFQTFDLRRSYLWGMDLSGSLQGSGGVGGLLATTIHNPASATYFPTYDGNGNVSEYLDSTGTPAAHFEYDPFGNAVVNSDVAGMFPHRFSTKPVDSVTGLLYYGYRYYDPVTGRWMSRDPICEKGGINLYMFCGNQPIYDVDFLGLLAIIHGKEPDSKRNYRDKSKLAKREIRRRYELDPRVAGFTDANWPSDIARCDCDEKTKEYTLTLLDARLKIEVIYIDDTIDFKGRGVEEHEQIHVDHHVSAWNEFAQNVNPKDGSVFSSEDECEDQVNQIEALRLLSLLEAMKKDDALDAESYEK